MDSTEYGSRYNSVYSRTHSWVTLKVNTCLSMLRTLQVDYGSVRDWARSLYIHIINLIWRYIGRNDEELEQIAIKHSVGGKRSRQHASREDIIRMTKKREQEEFDTCGIGIYTLSLVCLVELMLHWNIVPFLFDTKLYT